MDPSTPVRRELSVSPGSIRDAVTSLLGATRTGVDAYEDFRAYLPTVKDWVFAVTGPEHVGPDGRYPVLPETFEEATIRNMYTSYPTSTSTAPTNVSTHPSAYYFGLPQDQIDDWNINQDNLLLAAADTIHLAGNFIALLDQAAQLYAKADHNATMPPPNA
ncbi:hypothetical protein ACQEVZ_39905 [Dactylosporangium sp. CA-152071]|uniref:hypothetical protein n=1 Tax=Dactylosporangium sp. CA-152071 TaxID=3239933 RepID=UPI003D92EE64